MSGYIQCVNAAQIQLDNILAVMSTEAFSRRQAAAIVGGRQRLMRLIADGSIDVVKPSANSPNGKWYCNAAQVLSHCRNMRPTRNR